MKHDASVMLASVCQVEYPRRYTTDGNIARGLVELNTISGTGYRYWGPLKVYTNAIPEPAIITEETFRADTVVDAKPYTPENWVATYDTTRFVTGLDTTGLVLKIDDEDTCLVYRHKEGAKYPVTCLLAPATNMEWKNYEFRDTIIVPGSACYDTVKFGMAAYFSNPDSAYKLTFQHDSAFAEGGGFSKTHLSGYNWTPGDTITAMMSLQNISINDIPEVKTYIQIFLGKNSGNEILYFDAPDSTANRCIQGLPAFWVDMQGIINPSGAPPLKIKGATVRKQQ